MVVAQQLERPYWSSTDDARPVLTLVKDDPDTTSWVGLTESQARPDALSVSDPLGRIVNQWVELATRHARTRHVGGLIVADVVGVPGAWAEGATAEEALGALPEVLTAWVHLKINDGDRDIPAMEGVKLVVDG